MGIFSKSNPVFEMLKADHRKVEEIFEEFEEATTDHQRGELVSRALEELDIHTALEEEIVYPALRAATEQEDVMDEALEEHHVAHTLIDELKEMTPRDERYAAKFTVLGESIKHHVKEEEGTMFPEAEDADVSWDALHEKIMARKTVLLTAPPGAGAKGERKLQPSSNGSSRRRKTAAPRKEQTRKKAAVK